MFKDLVKKTDKTTGEKIECALYYNAFTEDLFTWNNDLYGDTDRQLMFNKSSSFFGGLDGFDIESRIRKLLEIYADFDFTIHYADGYITFSRQITNARGKWIEKKGILYMPTFHPAALLRDESKKIEFFRDLKCVKEKYTALLY